MESLIQLLSWALLLVFPALLGYAWWVRHRRRRIEQLIERYACALCHADFAESMKECEGRPTRADLARLDAFQRRFAHWKVVCHECGAINICTAEGQPYRAFAS